MMKKLPVIAFSVLLAAGFANAQDTSDSASYDQGTVSDTSTAESSEEGSMSGTTESFDEGTVSGTTTDTTTTTTTTTDMKSQKKADHHAMANLQKGKDYTTIEFKKGQATLTDDQKNTLRKMVQDAKTSGNIENLYVAAWADQPFPKGEKAELPQAARDLAKQRAQAIEDFVTNELQVSNVDTFNMAEKADWMARAVNTQEAELKSLFSQQGAPQNIDPNELRIVKKEGAPMKAVIFIEKPTMGSKSGASMDTDTDMESDSEMASEDMGADDRSPASAGATEPEVKTGKKMKKAKKDKKNKGTTSGTTMGAEPSTTTEEGATTAPAEEGHSH